MSVSRPVLKRAAPFQFDEQPFNDVGGCIASYIEEAGIASVQIRRGTPYSYFAERAMSLYGIEPPKGPRCAIVDANRWVAVGVGSWLAIGPTQLVTELQTQFAEIASVADQSGGYAIFLLTGANVRDALGKMIPIDLHPGSFAVGSAACTVAAHIGVIMWRCADNSDGTATFELACLRSFSTDFLHELKQAAAEFGFRLQARPFLIHGV